MWQHQRRDARARSRRIRGHSARNHPRVQVCRPCCRLRGRSPHRCAVRGNDVLDEAVDCVVPVPLHWRREHQRGFNQAREIARHLGPPVVCALVRRRETRPQVELAADRRKANVAGAFAARRAWFRDDEIRGKNVLLVDDVSTTGATLEACAHVLNERGASAVFALTAARVITRRRHGQPNPESPIPIP